MAVCRSQKSSKGSGSMPPFHSLVSFLKIIVFSKYNIFIYYLGLSNVLIIFNSLSPNFLELLTTSNFLPIQLWMFYFCAEQFVLPNYSQEWGLLLSVVYLPGVTLLKKTDSQSPRGYQMLIVPQLMNSQQVLQNAQNLRKLKLDKAPSLRWGIPHEISALASFFNFLWSLLYFVWLLACVHSIIACIVCSKQWR